MQTRFSFGFSTFYILAFKMISNFKCSLSYTALSFLFYFYLKVICSIFGLDKQLFFKL